jgi:hypothetical protein
MVIYENKPIYFLINELLDQTSWRLYQHLSKITLINYKKIQKEKEVNLI